MRFEIAIGAILAQNTNWTGASRSITALHEKGLLEPDRLLSSSEGELHSCIKTSGTFARKAGYLRNLALKWNKINSGNPGRSLLLGIQGIGPETADCILLYGFGHPVFIADAYARRILDRMCQLGKSIPLNYEAVRTYTERRIPYQVQYLAEAHALLVEHAKRYCSSRPKCELCPVSSICGKNLTTMP